jgi:excisionase family DNA binding protein
MLDYRDPEWLADQLGVDKSTIYRYLQDGTLPGLQLGRKWLVSERQLIEFLDAEARRQTENRRQTGSALAALTRETKRVWTGSRMDKFSERARAALTSAQEEARSLRHNYIGTEHLLLGLIQGDGVAKSVMEDLGAGTNQIRTRILAVVRPGEAEPPEGRFGLTPGAKKSIELAVDEARQFNHSYIGTEELLLGTLREGDGIAAGILASMGINYATARNEVVRRLSSAQARSSVIEATLENRSLNQESDEQKES